ncbi:hypothetical protein [Cupriavidus sp. CuC1]|uniref:hypothetical protein n=1 Tax=Cupriavidus sp. CuC1 TaxID=3373131 RepID=UPI0037D05868
MANQARNGGQNENVFIQAAKKSGSKPFYCCGALSQSRCGKAKPGTGRILGMLHDSTMTGADEGAKGQAARSRWRGSQ